MRLIGTQKCESYTTCYFKTKNNFILLFNGAKGNWSETAELLNFRQTFICHESYVPEYF